MRLIFITLLFNFSLFGAGFWTLTGSDKLHVYVQNNISEINPKTVTSIKEKMQSTLSKLSVKTDGVDGGTMMVKLNSIKGSDYFYVTIKLAVGEEVMTHRKGDIETFALTFDSDDFIETDELDADVLESIDFLLSEYAEQFEDDRE